MRTSFIFLVLVVLCFLTIIVILQENVSYRRLILAGIPYNIFESSGVIPKTKANVYGREHVYEDRRTLIPDGCRKVNRAVVKGLDSNNSRILVEKIHNIYYCPIPKVSSTFWKRILTVFASQGKLKSPFDISLGGVNLSKLKQLSEEEKRNLKENGTSFIFVRDPYARLFSGYENKLYHANLLFWRATGRQVVHKIRGNYSDVYENFGFDVTFLEFIKYILYLSESGNHINIHFSPMNEMCDPCSTDFQYIGKLETLREDADFLISKWKNQFPEVFLHFDDFHMETAVDTASGRVNFLFQAKKILKEIKFPFIKMMLRTWRDLQIRGYLSKYINFPYTQRDADSITKDEFLEAVKTALSIPVNRSEVKQQRQEALIQAYRQVPLEDMERLRRYVLEDCLLFGFDDRPKILFNRTVNVEDDFTYLDGLSKD